MIWDTSIFDTRVLEPLDNPFGPSCHLSRPYILPTNLPPITTGDFFPDVYATAVPYQKTQVEPRLRRAGCMIVGPFKRKLLLPQHA